MVARLFDRALAHTCGVVICEPRMAELNALTSRTDEAPAFLLGEVRAGFAHVTKTLPLTATSAPHDVQALQFAIAWDSVAGALFRDAGVTGHLLGIFHQHPEGAPIPSAEDLARIRAAPWIWLIAGRQGGNPSVALEAWGHRDCAVRRLRVLRGTLQSASRSAATQ